MSSLGVDAGLQRVEAQALVENRCPQTYTNRSSKRTQRLQEQQNNIKNARQKTPQN
jgi:hypothetical protein